MGERLINLDLKMLDGFCGGGGTAMGAIQAGAVVIGIDILKKCRRYYPGIFIQGNVLKIETWTQLNGHPFLEQFDLLWFSPPCQRYSPETKIKGNPKDHPDLIEATREIALHTGLPYIIENVEGAKDLLRNPIMLCGYMFKDKEGRRYRLERHRYFECSFSVTQPQHPDHKSIPEEECQKYSVVGNPVGSITKGIIYADVIKEWPRAMGLYHIPPGSRLFAEAIPPYFSRYLIEQFKEWRCKNE